MIVQEPVQAAIWHCLNHYAYTDAVFLSERLYAEVKTDESLFLLATSYYRNKQVNHAYNVLENHPASSPQCRFLHGRCAYELQMYREAELALTETGYENTSSMDNLVAFYGEQAAFALVLLASTFMKTDRRAKAPEAFRRALKLNPFLWSSFVSLCGLGDNPEPQNIFHLSSLDNLSTCHGLAVTPDNFLVSSNPELTPLFISTPQIVTHRDYDSSCAPPDDSSLENSMLLPLPATRQRPFRCRMMSRPLPLSSPSFGVLPLDSSESFNGTPLMLQPTLTEANDQNKSLAKKVKAHVGHLISRKETPLQNSRPMNVNNLVTPDNPIPIANLNPNVRRSTRLFSNNSVKENTKSPNRNKFATPKSPSRKTKQRITKCNLNKNSTYVENARNRMEKEKSDSVSAADTKIITPNNMATLNQQMMSIQKQSAEGLMSLLRDMGKAYLHFSQFECQEAVDELRALPEHHRDTCWVYILIGRAFFEMADYENCIKYFTEVRNMEPHRIDYLDVYSTAMWHLQKEVTLSALTQDLIALDKNSPITWCVAGNCFSLHKEHDTAIKFFQRAVQVDPQFTYAYTLLGHEYIMTEELEKASECFRNATRIDPRHYNAHFGMGTIYSKQERFRLAESSYGKALRINPQNSVLMCHLGVVQHALKKTDKALEMLDDAIGKDPKNPLCKFHRSSIYFAVGRHAEALKELEELKEIVPKESLVYYLIGKVHKKLGNTNLALMHFSWATDLDPKGASSQIREAFDPADGTSIAELESPKSPGADGYNSEGNSTQPDDRFGTLPEDSDDSL